jgi:uncharacterized membrane protein YebE (DUF533 family)
MTATEYASLPAMPTSPYASTPAVGVPAAPPAPASAEPDHALAMLLVRAMVAAANADGAIDAKERGDILSRLDAAGVGPEERATLEKELDAPRPITALVADVKSREIAEQIYVVSCLAIEADTPAERAYLKMLPMLLSLDEPAVKALHDKMGRSLPA